MSATFPKSRILLFPWALLCATALQAAPSINTPVVTPLSLKVNQPIQVTASCKINTSPGDPMLLSGGVNLVRLTATGAAVSTIGVMHDDGLGGDVTAGDGVFTLQFTANETAAGQFELQCTAAFQGVLQRVKSPAVTVTVGASSGTISAPTFLPASIPFGIATAVTTSATITGGAPDAGSVMLQRLDSSGRVLAIVGNLHDDGLNGDTKANDGIFTLVSSFAEFGVGPIFLRVSATFSGAVSHVFSPLGTLTVTGTPPPTVTITAPTSLSFLNISPTTVTGTVSDPKATVVINSIAAPVANGIFTASVPLAEGPNILTATATSASGAAVSASITVTLDTTPPHVTITSPADQFLTTDSSISVAGNVNDTVVGTVNSQQAQVKVNNLAAQVANRTFLATTVPLNLGNNTIQAVAVDHAGNSATTQITVVRQAPQPGQIQSISGNNQTATIGTALVAPLVVSLTEGQATATWKLGMRSGAGSDSAQAYSVGYAGTALFTATANQGTPGMIVIDSGNNQTGAVNQALPKPFIAVVTDGGHNRLANVPVTFTVNQGGGSFAGQPSTTVNTDSDGRAAASLVLGFQEGISNNLVMVDFPANTFFPATFTASGVGPGDPAKTVIAGIVLDNSNQPIPDVSVRAVLTNILNSNLGAVQAAAAVQTDAKGQFSITNTPVGFVKLFIDGSTATVPGVFPTLDYDMVTVAGQINTVGQPIYLLPIKTTNQLCVTPTTGGGTLSIPEAPGFSLTFGPGQVTFPGGSKTGCVSVTVVHPDKVPMAPGFGQQPRFIATIQPSGALFNPPAPITLPNVDGLAPREVTEMYSFDHDIGSFVAIGTGTVSDDGLVIRSNQGVGVLKAGWHCGGNPNQPGTVATCPVCSFCQGTTCTPQGNGTPCGNGGTCQFTGVGQPPVCNCPAGQVLNTTTGTCVNTGPCPAGYSLTGGQCCQGATCIQPSCPPGMVFDATTGTCVNSSPCQPGYTLVAGQCCYGNSCVPPQCPPGLTFNPATGTCQSPTCGNCSSGNPCIDGSCGANNQCVFSPNQLCQNACNGATSGSCSVNRVSGTCDASGNCNLCGALGAGAPCTCAGGATGTCNSSGQCTGCPNAIINGILTPSDNFAGRNTTRFGVGETINLTFTSIPPMSASQLGGLQWVLLSGGGNLTASTDGTGTLTAPESAASVSLQLQYLSGSMQGQGPRYAIDVVEPSAASYVVQQPGTSIDHCVNTAYIGILADFYLAPTDVSFENMQFREGSVAAVGTGYYQFANGVLHCGPLGCAPLPVSRGNAATGSRVLQAGDFFKTGENDGPPFQNGSFTWDIPWLYRVGATEKQFATGRHQATLSASSSTSGTVCISKDGVSPLCVGTSDPSSSLLPGTPPSCPPVPMNIKALGANIAPDGSSGSFRYQVIDQNGANLAITGMTPLETVQSVRLTFNELSTGTEILTENFPSTPTQPFGVVTDSSGQFVDQPVGFADLKTFRMQHSVDFSVTGVTVKSYSIVVNGITYANLATFTQTVCQTAKESNGVVSTGNCGVTQ